MSEYSYSLLKKTNNDPKTVQKVICFLVRVCNLHNGYVFRTKARFLKY